MSRDRQRHTIQHSGRTVDRLHNILAQPYAMWHRHSLKCELCLSDDCSVLDEDGHYSPGSASSVVVPRVSLDQRQSEEGSIQLLDVDDNDTRECSLQPSKKHRRGM